MFRWLKQQLRRWLDVEGSCQAVPTSHSNYPLLGCKNCRHPTAIIHCWDVKKDGTRVSQPYRVIGLVGVLGLMVVGLDGTAQRCVYYQDVVEPELYWHHIRRLLHRHVFEWKDLPPPKQPV
jgi:hypothetical protein